MNIPYHLKSIFVRTILTAICFLVGFQAKFFKQNNSYLKMAVYIELMPSQLMDFSFYGCGYFCVVLMKREYPISIYVNTCTFHIL